MSHYTNILSYTFATYRHIHIISYRLVSCQSALQPMADAPTQISQWMNLVVSPWLISYAMLTPMPVPQKHVEQFVVLQGA